MSQSVRYHHGPRNEFSLAYVSPDSAAFREQLEQYAAPMQLITTRRALDTPVYLAYSHTPVSDEPVTIPEHPFVQTQLRVFAGIVDGREEAGDEVRGSKSARLTDVPDLLSSRIDWRQSVPEVGGQLVSNLILAHVLPNANHRTSLGMLVVYLQSLGVDITPTDLQEAGVNEYITDSKQILTVRRNTTKFRILAQCGCETVERKGGIQIPLAEFNLTTANPYTEFANAHERRSIQFVEQLLDEQWQVEEDPGLNVFLSRL